ncbi:hypothetical protein [Paenibacillus sp. y28]|uniref:hypothetical protein n=1 Tax=Paenibacillus sp. y28 TaxID=3129110 RepID=UPI00301B63A7
MKQWRVGTLSMGSSLLLLGIILFISQWQGVRAFDQLLVWWPLVLVLLGLEIVTYMLLARGEKPLIHYDVFSMFIVAILLVCCLVFTALASTGVVTAIRHNVMASYTTGLLPEFRQAAAPELKKVIVDVEDAYVYVDKASTLDVELFGSTRQRTESALNLNLNDKDSFYSSKLTGDTLYITVPSITAKGLIRWTGDFEKKLTVVVPETVKVEVRGSNRLIRVNTNQDRSL